MPKKFDLKSLQAKLAERYTLVANAEALTKEEYLVPSIVQNVGDLIGVAADLVAGERHMTTANALYVEEYAKLVEGTALLLAYWGIESVDKEYYDALRYSKTAPGHVTLLSRVDRLHRAWATDEPEHARAEAQRLWATLEDRCEALVGKPFAELIP